MPETILTDAKRLRALHDLFPASRIELFRFNDYWSMAVDDRMVSLAPTVVLAFREGFERMRGVHA